MMMMRGERDDDCPRRRPGYPNARPVLNGGVGRPTALLLNFA